MKNEKTGWRKKYFITDLFFWVAMIVAVFHAVDHVLRDIHSGWPFTEEFTTFSVGLMFFPIIILARMLRAGPVLYIVGSAMIFIYFTLIHTMEEPLAALYHPWREGENLLNITNNRIGRAAQIITGLLLFSLLGIFVSSIRDGFEYGFRFRRKKIN